MAIYNINGWPLSQALDIDGNMKGAAYDIAGNQVFFGGPKVIKVMSYNVGGWYIGSGSNVPASKKAEYLALQTGMIIGNDPDVLCIQEYLPNFSSDGTSALEMLQELFPYVHAVPSGTWYGRAICSKYPISNYTQRQYTVDSSRYFDSCTITFGSIPVTFVTTHLALSQSNRNPEISQLITYLQTLDRFVACGDYNSMIVDDSANVESEAYADNVKPFVDKGFHTANYDEFGFMITCVDRSNGTNYYLDNVYTSANIDILNAYVDETKLHDLIDDPIDHMPFIATLQIGG